MEENKLKKLVQSGIEAEAAALEKNVEENSELNDLEMPTDSFEEMRKKIEASRKSEVKPFCMRRRTLLAVALVAILAVAAGVGATGAKLFVPKVENTIENGELSIDIDNDEDTLIRDDITEEEAYEEIEEKLGILALRLLNKPTGMELEVVYIGEEMGEALMEFYYEDHILTIYENKQSDSATFGTKIDGMIIDSVEIFHVGQTVELMEVDKGSGENFLAAQLEVGNAYYYITSDMGLDEFKNILSGIFFDTM